MNDRRKNVSRLVMRPLIQETLFFVFVVVLLRMRVKLHAVHSIYGKCCQQIIEIYLLLQMVVTYK